MAVTIEYNGGALGTVLTWELRRTPVAAFDGETVDYYEVHLEVTGFYAANANATAREVDLAALKTACETAGQTCTLKQDGTTLLSFTAANTIRGGNVAAFSVPGALNGFKAGYSIPFAFSLKTFQDQQGAGPILLQREATVLDTDQDGLITRTIQGQLRVAKSAGTTALAELAGVEPATPSGYDRIRTQTTEDDELLSLTYVYVDQELGSSGGSGGAGTQWQVGLSVANGTETWSIAGTLVGGNSTLPTESQVDALVRRHFPSNVSLTQRDISRNQNKRELTFSVAGVVGLGKGKMLAYSARVSLTMDRHDTIFQAIGGGGPDVRQDALRPAITLQESGRAVGQGTAPAFPPLLGKQTDIHRHMDELGEIVTGPDGKIVSVEITWERTYRLLNEVEPGGLPDFKALAVDPATYEANHPMQGAKTQGKVA